MQERSRAFWCSGEGTTASFELTEPEAYRCDVPRAEVHILDAGHFALDTAADEIAALVGRFVTNTRSGKAPGHA